MATLQQNLVGPQVRARRVAAGLSQAALAAKLQLTGWDISRGGLSKIEARLRRVTDAEVVVLAQVLGCGAGDLLCVPGKSTIRAVLRQGQA